MGSDGAGRASRLQLMRMSLGRTQKEPAKYRAIPPGRIPTKVGCVKINMESPDGPGARGPFEARYLAFLETITHLRPSLHRYCSRMTGSVLDGEDVVQTPCFRPIA